MRAMSWPVPFQCADAGVALTLTQRIPATAAASDRETLDNATIHSDREDYRFTSAETVCKLRRYSTRGYPHKINAEFRKPPYPSYRPVLPCAGKRRGYRPGKIGPEESARPPRRAAYGREPRGPAGVGRVQRKLTFWAKVRRSE
ncbi:hypothetical protein GCM10010486_61910 [Nonomuraea roseoviolacea subsp. carminata]